MRFDAYLTTTVCAAAALTLAACGEAENAPNAELPESDTTIASPEPGVSDAPDLEDTEMAEEMEADLSAFIDGLDRRSEAVVARDAFRHPAETLEFFGLEPDMTVVEAWPGGGWYTAILAPYLAQGGGTLYAAHGSTNVNDTFMNTFMQDADYYGDIELTVLSSEAEGVAPAESADMVLTFRNVHNWYFSDFAGKAFEDFYAALKPGGTLGVVEHRLPEEMDDAMMERSGYMKVSTVKSLAEAAGFEFVESSEVNANSLDTADHPLGVWTLPPTSRTTDREGNTPEGFDPAKYEAIGESDRMTLKFRKPIADEALLE